MSKKKKLVLKTFFGNPEVEIFCLRFDPEDSMIAAGMVGLIWIMI